MACIMRGIVLFSLVFAATEATVEPLFCAENDDIPWIPEEGITVFEPWMSYPAPEHACCDVPSPDAYFDPQEKCALCYDLTHSTPGFAANPNNCAQFYMCELIGEHWNASLMVCPNCTFWNQEILSCETVYDGCYKSVSIYTDETPTGTYPTEGPLMFCIDFEDDSLVGQGADRPWVMNDHVTIVEDADCPQGDRCGFFNESRLEIPFFSNAYSSFPSLRISFNYRRTGSSPATQGIISNDCMNGAASEAGNSLYASCADASVEVGLRDPLASASSATTYDDWSLVAMSWVDGQFTLAIDGAVVDSAAFLGPIRNSHCPLVIGSFIKEASTSYFQGYMDNICFFKW